MRLAELAGGILKLGACGLALDIRGERIDLGPQAAQGLRGGVWHEFGLTDTPLFRVLAEACRAAQIAEEFVRGFQSILDREKRGRLAEGTEQALARAGIIEPLEIEAHTRLTDAKSELD